MKLLFIFIEIYIFRLNDRKIKQLLSGLNYRMLMLGTNTNVNRLAHISCSYTWTNYMLRAFFLFFAVFTIGCRSGYKDEKSSPRRADLAKAGDETHFPVTEIIIDNGEEEGWGADIRLSVTDIINSDSFTTYIVKSLFKKENVGFNINLGAGGGLPFKTLWYLTEPVGKDYEGLKKICNYLQSGNMILLLVVVIISIFL